MQPGILRRAFRHDVADLQPLVVALELHAEEAAPFRLLIAHRHAHDADGHRLAALGRGGGDECADFQRATLSPFYSGQVLRIGLQKREIVIWPSAHDFRRDPLALDLALEFRRGADLARLREQPAVCADAGRKRQRIRRLLRIAQHKRRVRRDERTGAVAFEQLVEMIRQLFFRRLVEGGRPSETESVERVGILFLHQPQQFGQLRLLQFIGRDALFFEHAAQEREQLFRVHVQHPAVVLRALAEFVEQLVDTFSRRLWFLRRLGSFLRLRLGCRGRVGLGIRGLLDCPV